MYFTARFFGCGYDAVLIGIFQNPFEFFITGRAVDRIQQIPFDQGYTPAGLIVNVF